MTKLYSLILSLLLITGALYSQHEIVTDNNRACKNVGVRFTCKTSNTAAKYYKWGKSWPLSNYTLSKDTVFSFPEVDYYYINVEIYDENKQYIGSAYKYYNVLGLTGANIPEKVCPGDEVRFSLNGSGFLSCIWWFGDGKTSSDINPAHTYSQTGTYNVKGIIKSECGTDTVKHIISVIDGLGFIGYMSSNISETLTCPGSPVYISPYSQRNYPYTIDFGDGTTATESSYHTYNNVGKYPLSFTFRNGCGKDSVRRDTITIADNLTWKNKYIYIDKPTKGCPGENFYFSTISGADSTIWTFADTTLYGSNPSRSFSEVGKHYFTLRLVNHCGNDTILKDSVSIEGNIREFDINGFYKFDKVCPQTYADFYVFGKFKNVAWHFEDGTIINETYGSKMFDAYGKYPLKLILTNYCGIDSVLNDTISIVNNELNFNSFYIEKKLVCPGEEIKLLNIPGELKEILIDYGDGFFTKTKESHAYSNPGKYYIKINAVNNCGNSASYLDSITVSGDYAPFGSVSIKNKSYTTICPGSSIDFTTDNYKSIVWEFEDQKRYGRDVNFTFNTPGKNIIKLTVKNGCGNDTTVEGTVNVVTSMDMDMGFNYIASKFCNGAEIKFDTYHQGFKYFEWSFGDGDTSKLENPTHVYKENGTYYPVFTLINGCGKTIKDSFKVVISDTFNIPKPIISHSLGCPGDQIEFNLRLSSNSDYLLTYDRNPSNYQIDWEFADGIKSGTSVLHSFSTEGRHPFKVRLRNKCGKELVVNDTVDIGGTLFKDKLNWFTNKASCLGDSVIFFIPPFAKTMELDFGDNTKTSSFKDLWYNGEFYTEIFTDLFYKGKWYKVASHKYAAEGNYKVKLKATDGCNNVYSDSIAFSVNSFSLPSGEIVYNSNRTYCIGEKVKFDAFGAAGAIIDFGDGKKQTLGNNAVSSIEHKYEASGLYNVKIKVSNACSDTAFYYGVIQIDTCRKVYLSNDIITETEGIRVYPNPARDRITFENIDGAFSEEYIYEILDLNGRICKQGNIEEGTANFTLDISKLTNGIYLMKLRSRSNIIVQKFIKN